MSENVAENGNAFQQLDNEFTHMLSIVHKRKAHLRHAIKAHQKAKKWQYKQRLQFIIAKLKLNHISIPDEDSKEDNTEEAANNQHKKMHSQLLPLSLKYQVTEVKFDADAKRQLRTMVDHFGIIVVRKTPSKPNPIAHASAHINANTIANSNTNAMTTNAQSQAQSQCQTIFDLLLSKHMSNTGANSSYNLLVLTLVVFHVFRFAIGKNQYIHETKLQTMIERVLAAEYNRCTNDHNTIQYLPSVFNLIGMPFTRYLQLLHTHHICQISMVSADQIMLCEKVFMSTAFDLMTTPMFRLNSSYFTESELGLIRDNVRRRLAAERYLGSVSMISSPPPPPKPSATASTNLNPNPNPSPRLSPNPSEQSPFQAQGLNMNVANVLPNNSAVISTEVVDVNKHGDGDGDDESAMHFNMLRLVSDADLRLLHWADALRQLFAPGGSSSAAGSAFPLDTARCRFIVSFFLYCVFTFCRHGYPIEHRTLLALVHATFINCKLDCVTVTSGSHPHPPQPFRNFEKMTGLKWKHYLGWLYANGTGPFISSHLVHHRKGFDGATVKLDGIAYDSDMHYFMKRAVFKKGLKYITSADLRLIEFLANCSVLWLWRQPQKLNPNRAKAAFIAHIQAQRGCGREQAARLPLQSLHCDEKEVMSTGITRPPTTTHTSIAVARPSSVSNSGTSVKVAVSTDTDTVGIVDGSTDTMIQPPPTPKVANAVVLEKQPLTLAMLAKERPAERKGVIGNRLFPKIRCIEPRLAGKITGMILEMDNRELLLLLTDESLLLAKVNEALAVLKDVNKYYT